MIDFSSASFAKMDHVGVEDAAVALDGLLLDGETIRNAYKGSRNWVVFTDRRLIVVTTQGMTGKRRDYTTLPYTGIRAASVETAGGFDVDAKMDLWFADLGFAMLGGLAAPCRIRLEFAPGIDVRELERFVVGKML